MQKVIDQISTPHTEEPSLKDLLLVAIERCVNGQLTDAERSEYVEAMTLSGLFQYAVLQEAVDRMLEERK